MSSNWPIVTIDEIKAKDKSSIAIGPFGSRMKSDCYVDSGIPVIRGNNLGSGPEFVNDFVYVSEDKANALASCNVYSGDLVFPHRGSIGEVGIVEGENRYVLSTSLMKLTCDAEKAVPQYVYYFFKSARGRHELLKNASQVGTPGIGQPLTSLKSVEIPLPPISAQKQIATVLRTLDSKIHLNHQINQTLEQMAQAIFKSWFVDFEPVKAKIAALEAGGSEEDALLAAMQAIFGTSLFDADASAAGAQAALTRLQAEQPEQYAELRATAALFPSAMRDSELGVIPEGWSAGTLSDVANLNKQSWTKRTIPSELVYVDLANTKNGTIESTTTYTSDDAPSRAKRILSDGDTIVGTVRPGNRSFAFIKQPQTTLTGSTGFAVLSPKQVELAEFVYITATSDESITYLAHLADGGAYPAVRPDVVVNFPCVLPPEHLIAHFHMSVRPFFDQIAVNKQEASTLSELRDSLLPKLLSGELNVACGDNQIAEAMETADV